MNNWFKKLFGLEDDEVAGNEQKVSSSLPTRRQQKEKKEKLVQTPKREAKVAYEYPKGQFRFPVIPDEEDFEASRITNIVVEKSVPIEQSPKASVTPIQSVTRKEYRNQSKEQKQKSSILSNGSKGRFKPSDVPSPVYGFSRPNPTSASINTNEIAASSEVEAQEPSVNEKIHPNCDNELAVLTVSEDNYVKNEIDFSTETNLGSTIDQVLAPSIEPTIEISREIDLPPTIEVSDIESVQPTIKSVQPTIENVQPTIESIQPTIESVQPKIESFQANIEANAPSINAMIADKQEEKNEEKVSIQDPVDLEKIEIKAIKSNHENTNTTQTQKRGIIPFNVMMLKQDKKQDKQMITKSSQPDQVSQEAGITKPALSLLDIPPVEVDEDKEWLQEQSKLLDQAFESFNVGAKVVKATKGPAVTQFEVQPEIGVRVNKITNLADDLKLALAAKDIRIEAPIPGKSTVGIEVPNRKSRPVLIREILRSPVFQKSASPLVVALGLDISGQPVVTDINKMPHGLIAGATGSGKSVCINSIIISLLYKTSPHEVKLMLIDPKMVELAPYNGIPHLVSPVITDVKAATAALKWAVEEMERRYELFAHEGVRDITRFNEKVKSENPKAEIMPYLVIIIDELADLMMVSPADVEDAICRIAQKARACGIHLLLATQRPSVDVITGLIKANVPTRIAFSVSSQVDSRTIIDISGAEKLLGRGDMLFLENGSNKPVRIQGNFVTDDEIERVTQFVRKQMEPNYLFVQEELIKQAVDFGADDDLFDDACQFVVEQEVASASSLQRRFRIGYNRAARLVDMMEAQGIVSEPKGSKPREVLISKEQLENK